MNDAPLYRLERIARVIETGQVILDIAALDLPAGEITAIVGPNGAGKSTLLKVLAFLEPADRGSLSFRGVPVESRDFRRHRRQVTMVDQAPLLFRGTVSDNVAYGLRVRGVPPADWPGRVADALSLVDLGGFADRSVRGLSGGETQRVAIARALVFQPQVILLDEPTAGVDVARMEMVESLIKELYVAMGVSILVSTHDLAQAYRLTDRVVHLAGGKRVAGSIENLFCGQAGQGEDGREVHMRSGATLHVGFVQTGFVRVAIPAAAIAVEPFCAGEGRDNRFDAVITRLELRGGRARLLLSGDLNLRAELPPEELQRADLGLGSRVTAMVPPAAVQLL